MLVPIYFQNTTSDICTLSVMVLDSAYKKGLIQVVDTLHIISHHIICYVVVHF